MNYLKKVLTLTIQETSPPLDEFEKPHDIPTVIVNRIQAHKDKLKELSEEQMLKHLNHMQRIIVLNKILEIFLSC
jgi:hypothetical protein